MRPQPVTKQDSLWGRRKPAAGRQAAMIESENSTGDSSLIRAMSFLENMEIKLDQLERIVSVFTPHCFITLHILNFLQHMDALHVSQNHLTLYSRLYCHIFTQMSFHTHTLNFYGFYTALRDVLCRTIVRSISLHITL